MRLLLPALVFSFALGACSSDTTPVFSSSQATTGSGGDAGTICAPGIQIACACPGGIMGTQVCKASGTGFDPCACGTGASGAGASGGEGSGATGGQGAGASGGGGAGAAGGGGAGGTGGGTFCQPGSTLGCYTGPAGTENVGLCAPGTQTCLPDGSAYGPCAGDVTPVPETCATAGDDDCDGQANEEGPDCGCVPGSQQSCYSGPPATQNVGPCHGGTQQCKLDGSGYGPCVGEVTPQPETCNTPGDDDCDGSVNEGGAGCVCAPSSMEPCYSGPAGTENVGICKGGIRTCNALGTAWGPCFGEVVPGQDLCATAADEDCNGSPVPCQTNPTWSKRFGSSAGGSYAQGFAVDGAGNVFVSAYSAAGSIDLGGGPISGLALAKFDALGNHVWSKGFGAASGWASIGVDATGNVLLTGGFVGTLDFGGGSLVNSSNQMNLYVAKLDGQGNHVWSKHLGVVGQQSYSTAIAGDPSGNVLVGGNFSGPTDFGGGPLTPISVNGGDVFMLKLNPGGAHVWSKQGNTLGAFVDGVSADGLGNAVFTGWFSGTFDLGGTPVSFAGGADVFVARLDPTGAPLFVKAFGDNGDQAYCSSSLDAAGNVLVTGRYNGTLDFGGGPLVATSGPDVFAAKLDTTGAHVWSKRFGNGSFQLGGGIAADPVGNVLMTTGLTGSIDYGGGVVTSGGSFDLVVAKYSPAGALTWGNVYGDAVDQTPYKIATDSVGSPVVMGSFGGTIDFGQGPLVAQSGNDIFVAKLAP